MSEYIVEMKDIYKRFPGVTALSGVQLSVKKGEIHALVGENGAGKSTLIKILTGAYQKDEGIIAFDGVPVELKSPHFAKKLGIQAVYQDITLAAHLSVGENFFLGELPMSSPLTVDWKRVVSVSRELLASLELDIDPKTLLKDLPIAQQEMVAIAKAVHDKSKLIIFDEPTALLANEECEQLYKIIQKLKSEGLGIIYISHRMEEIFRICDTVTILKDGCFVGSMPIGETREDDLISRMVGRKVSEMYSIEHQKPGEVVLSVQNLSRKGVFENVTFELHRGEILGMFGLIGAGRTEIVSSIFGAGVTSSGKVRVFGKDAKIRRPRDAIRLGISLLPENRRTQGLALPLSVKVNTNVVVYGKDSRFGVINRRLERSNAERYVREMATKTPSIDTAVRNLSGGNQQKVVIGKWLACESKIMIFDEPTVGIDVGSKAEIYKLLERLTETGTSIILISSYLPEVIGLSDRILVIAEGRQMAIVGREEAAEERILRLASGIPDRTNETTREVL